MNEGDVVLAPLPQANGLIKNRPVIALRRMPPYADWLVCGVSTQLHQQVGGFDEVIDTQAADFATSGLKAASVVRLGYLAVLPAGNFLGKIGKISAERHRRLLQRLCQHLQPSPAP